MRTLERNKRDVYYALYEDMSPIEDEYGNPTGEYELVYGEPVLWRVNVSAAKGQWAIHQFGETENYDKVLVSDLDVPISKTSVLWIDNLDTSKPHDYVVKTIAKSLNVTTIAVSKVRVRD